MIILEAGTLEEKVDAVRLVEVEVLEAIAIEDESEAIEVVIGKLELEEFAEKVEGRNEVDDM